MAFAGNSGVTEKIVSSAQTSFRQELVLSTNAETQSFVLLTLGLPRVQIYLRQTIGAIGASVIPEFSVSDRAEGTPQWDPITTPVVTPFMGPVLLNYPLACKQVRISATRPAGQATTLVVIIMAAQ